jgi:hypothetical protein
MTPAQVQEMKRFPPTMWHIIKQIPLFGCVGEDQLEAARLLEYLGFIRIWEVRCWHRDTGQPLKSAFGAALTDAGAEASETEFAWIKDGILVGNVKH